MLVSYTYIIWYSLLEQLLINLYDMRYGVKRLFHAFCMWLCLLGSSTALLAQSITIKVVDEADAPLPGVIVKYGSSGGATSPKGLFVVPDHLSSDESLTFSYIGYESVTLTKGELSRLRPPLVKLQPANATLSDLVVTGESNPIRREAVGETINLSRMGVAVGADLGEVLTSVKGVSLISNGASAGKPVIHGMHSHRILILNNGVRHVGQQWSSSHAPEVEIAQAGRVSVLKGAESVRYGADALGGVILLEQQALPYHLPQLSGRGTLSVASNGMGYGVTAQLEKGSRGPLAWRAQAGYHNSGDKQTAHYLLNNTGQREWNVLANIGWQGKKGKAELLITSLWEKEGVFFGAQMGNVDLLRERIEMGRPPVEVLTPFTRFIDYGYHTVSHSLAKLSGEYQVAPHHKLKGMLSYQLNLRNEYHLRRNKLSYVPEMSLAKHNIQGEANWLYTPQKRWSVEAGLLALYTNNYNNPGTGVVPMIPNYVEGGVGAYSIGKYTKDCWGVELGVRADYNSITADGIDYDSQRYGGTKQQFNITYALSGFAELAKGLTLRSQLGTAWRAPHVAELYSNGLDQESGIYLVGQKELKSERALKWITSLGYKHRWIELDIEGYLQWVDNYIYQEPTGQFHTLVSGTYPLFKIRQTLATLHGVDAEATIHPLSWLSYRVGSGMLWASERSTGRYLPFIPPFHIEHELRGDFELLGGAFVALQHRYVAEQKRFDPATDLIPFAPPAYHLVELSIGLSHDLPNDAGDMSYTLHVENLLNQEYKEYTNLARYYSHDLGRNIRFSMIYHF